MFADRFEESIIPLIDQLALIADPIIMFDLDDPIYDQDSVSSSRECRSTLRKLVKPSVLVTLSHLHFYNSYLPSFSLLAVRITEGL